MEIMTTFAPHRDTVESFVDAMHGGADKDALSGILAEDVVLYGPLGDEPVTGREAVLEAMQAVGAVAPTSPIRKSSAARRTTPRTSDCRSKTPRSMEWTRFLLDADGKIAEVTILVAPAAGRCPDAAAPCWSAWHAALGTSHPHGVTAKPVP